MSCEVCGDGDYAFICPSCKHKGLLWAAKMALQAERGRKEFDAKMQVDAIVERSGGGYENAGNITLTIDPKAMMGWPGNCAPPSGMHVYTELGKVTMSKQPCDIARGLDDADIPGITPNVLGSNATPVGELRVELSDEYKDPDPEMLDRYYKKWSEQFKGPEQKVDDPFYVKQREDWRNQNGG